MRSRFLAVSLSIAVPIGALCAPLVHVHPDDPHSSHHASGRVHAHLSGHGLDDRGHDDDHNGYYEIEDHDDPPDPFAIEPEVNPEQVLRATFFVAVEVDNLIPAALRPLDFTLSAPLESIMRRPPAVSHGHDPPAASPSSPRAPPALLS